MRYKQNRYVFVLLLVTGLIQVVLSVNNDFGKFHCLFNFDSS